MSPTPPLSIRDNLNAQVRVSPETYVKFDETDQLILQNIFSEQGISIKYDILLILYEISQWKSVQELITPWPPEDQEKILDHLDMMISASIVQLSNSVQKELPESGLSSWVGKRVNINVENHHNMLKDFVRMTAYRRAIEQVVKPEDVVLDLGTGSGVLAFFAAKAGAQKVYGIEKHPHMVKIARQLAEDNGLRNIDFIEGASSIIKSDRLTPKPDVLISEIIGNGILEENILEFTLDARDRFLKPDGRMVPYQLDLYCFAFEGDIKEDRHLEVEEFQRLYGIDFSFLGTILQNKAVLRLDRYSPMMHHSMSPPMLVHSLDFRTLKQTFFSKSFTLEIQEDGYITAFCCYFRVHLDETTTLTNSPWAPQTHWTQLVYTLPKRLNVVKGEILSLKMVYDGALRVWFEE